MSKNKKEPKGTMAAGTSTTGRGAEAPGADGVAPHAPLGPVEAAAMHARDLDVNSAIAKVQRVLADQDSSAFMYAGNGYDLSTYASTQADSFAWRDEITVEDIDNNKLRAYWDGALKLLPLVADQFNHAALAMTVDPTVGGVGFLWEALDRVADVVGTLKVVGEELDSRGINPEKS